MISNKCIRIGVSNKWKSKYQYRVVKNLHMYVSVIGCKDFIYKYISINDSKEIYICKFVLRTLGKVKFP